jgi:hypothetical protein
MTLLSTPETENVFGFQSMLVLETEPDDPTETTDSEAAAGTNITCHLIGSWFPAATTEKVAAQRKMCQTKTRQKLGATTWDPPALQYTMVNQSVGTPGAPGNEAFEALPEGAVRYLELFTGIPGNAEPDDGDAYQLLGVRLGPQVRGASADDAGGESTVTQELEILAEYTDGPIDGVRVAT